MSHWTYKSEAQGRARWRYEFVNHTAGVGKSRLIVISDNARISCFVYSEL